MANTLKHKRSSTTGETPAASELEVGEIAVNTADAKLFVKHTDNSVKEISGQEFSTVASSSDLGLVKIGYTESGKNYPVELSTDNQMFVNVPWTDTDTNTTYTAGTGLDLSGTEFSLSSTISGKRDFTGGVVISNPSSVGHIQMGNIYNESGNAYIRGAFLVQRDEDQITYDSGTDTWTHAGGGSTDWSMWAHTASGMRFYTGGALASETDYTPAQFDTAYLSVAIGTNGQWDWKKAAQFSGNVTISGNLTVSGSTTTVNSGTINLADSILTLNSDLDSAVAPTENAGFEVNRGSGDNVSLVWDETDDRFEVKGVSQLTFNVEGTGGSGSYSQLRARNPDDGASHEGAEVYLRSFGWGEGRLQVGSGQFTQAAGRTNISSGNQTLYINTGTGAGLGILNTSPTALLTVGNGTNYTLGGTAGNTKRGLDLQYDSQNTDYLRFYMKRAADGSDWETADHYIQRRVDSTDMGFIKFGHHTASDLITFGRNASEYMQLTGTGQLDLFNKFTVDMAQNSNAPMASPHLHLEASSTTNTTGLTSIRMDTSTVDNYGVSINAARKGTNGVPTFQIRMHNNSSTGLSSFEIDSTGNLHMPAWIKHIQDSNTQFGFPSNDTFVISTGGSYRFEVTNGTDDPTTRTYGLHESDENRERISGDGYVDGGTGGIIRYFKWGFEIGSSANGYKGITINGGKYKYFELEANIKGDSSANHQGFFWGNAVNNAYYGGSTTGYKLTHQNSTNFHIRDVNTNTTQTTINPGFGPNDGVWHHYKLTVTPDGYVRVYLDGDKVMEETGYIPSAAGYVGFLNYAGLAQFNNVQFRALTDDYVEVVDQIGLSDKIYHNGDTNNYMQFHATDQWRVVTSGSERLEVTNTTVMARGDNSVGFTNDGAAKHYAWRAVNNTSTVSNQWYKIARIVGSQATRFKIDIVGHQTSYGDGTQSAMSTLVGSLNNDNNYDIASYTTKNASGQSPIEQWGQVDVDGTSTDIYVKTDNYSEIAAWALISDGTIETVSNATNADGFATEPTGYSAATDYEIWHSGSDGTGSGLDADKLDGIQASSFLRSDAADTMTGALTLQQTLGDITHLTLKQENTSGDISSQNAFIDFTFIDANSNGTPQVRIGANVGEDGGDANTQALEGSGEFVVYTATGTSDTANSLTEKFRVSHDGKLFASSDRVFTDGYHPNADKWTTARTHTVTLTGDVTGSASQTVDGTGNKTWSVATTSAQRKNFQTTVARDSWVRVARVLGNNYGSTVRATFSGTTGNVVVAVVADIIVNHSGDIHISSQSGDYTALQLKVFSNGNNEDFDLYVKYTGANAGTSLTLETTVHALSDETITANPTDTAYSSGTEHIHTTISGGIRHSQSSGNVDTYSDGNYYVGTDKVWHAGNDGGGSGLDADKLDGLQSSSFLRSDAADSASGQITFTGKAHVNTNTNAQPLVVSRGGSNAQERLNIGIADTQAIFNYVEDTTNEGNGNFGGYVFQLGGNDGETTLNALSVNKSNTRITTTSGYIQLGPTNTSWCHITTDRGSFYFNQGLAVETGVVRSYDEDLNLNRAGSSTARIRVTSGETFSDQDLTVSGALSATTKSFVIDHPSKPGHKLRHGSLEGPENGVYVRGKCDGQTSFELPDYWADLVDQESITVQLTAIGGKQDLWVEDIQGQTVTIGSSNPAPKYFYIAHAERVDVEKFEVEYEA